MKSATCLVLMAVLLFAACHSNATSPTSQKGASSLLVTFTENPAPYSSTGCNASIPQGWYTQARIQETGGVNFTPGTFTQKLDGSTTNLLAESFNSRFGACTGSAFNEGVILANGAVCGIVGVCTSSTFRTYQFELTGTDANGHALTFASPLLQFGTRSSGQSNPLFDSSRKVMPPAPRPHTR